MQSFRSSSSKSLERQPAFTSGVGERGGFDLILGNPPWLKVEWNEAGILGERNPVFAVRKISASDLAQLRAEAFAQFPGLQADWLQELEEAEGTQAFLNAVQNYPLLKGVQTNLYKCFMPLAWDLASAQGVAGLLPLRVDMDAGVRRIAIRTPRGRDIMAACGQLKSESEKLRASARRKLAAGDAEAIA